MTARRNARTVRAVTDEALMRQALRAARIGVAHGAGPFAALVAAPDGGVLAVRTNAVVVSHDPTAHAEVLAIRAATTARGTHHLRGHTLVVTCTPCILCVGAIHWSGITRVVAAARAADAEAIGFVEGPPGFDAIQALTAAGIALAVDVERDAAIAVLRSYEGERYNG